MSDDTNRTWGGRFNKAPDKMVLDYTASVDVDRALALYDIEGSIAHAQMLAEQGIISKKDGAAIVKGLNEIHREIMNGKFVWKKENEDVHMCIEQRLVDKAGDAGRRLHTARSRNDQVALDTRLYLRDSIITLARMLVMIQERLIQLAESTLDIIIPGYTHLQQAQPIRMAHFWMAYYWQFNRDIERLAFTYVETNQCPLGAGALAGVNYNINRKSVADKLTFSGLTQNSIDAISNRDYIVQFLTDCALIQMHFSRLSEDLVVYSSSEFGFIEIGDDYTTGSSIMPNKKNPDVAELARGRTSRVYGNLMAMLTMLKGLPMSYNRDLQEDKPAAFDSAITVRMTAEVFIGMLDTIKINKERIADKMADGYMLATDLADYLVAKGVPFRDAHHAIGSLVGELIKKRYSLLDISYDDLKKVHSAFEEDALELLDYERSVDTKVCTGGTARGAVMEQIEEAKKILGENRGLLSL